MNSRRFTAHYLPGFPNERNSTPSAGALRNFRPLDDRYGSKAAPVTAAMFRPTSGLPPKAEVKSRDRFVSLGAPHCLDMAEVALFDPHTATIGGHARAQTCA